ncbi:MAG TPA: DUF4136 domain-containing protein [Thermodesulfovibrionales bacterium]|nr:DUF4136 domain-containing protein [Thermodesulfovibrionales bacterium]
MRIFSGRELSAVTALVFLSALVLVSCAPAIKYSYDTKASFTEGKSYAWAPSSVLSRQDPILERNVQALADQLLTEKGFSRTTERPDLLIAMSYEFDINSYQYGYQLRMLALNVYKMRSDTPPPPDIPRTSLHHENGGERREMVWRGTAVGTINTDAASTDLKQAVQGILSNFPPK